MFNLSNLSLLHQRRMWYDCVQRSKNIMGTGTNREKQNCGSNSNSRFLKAHCQPWWVIWKTKHVNHNLHSEDLFKRWCPLPILILIYFQFSVLWCIFVAKSTVKHGKALNFICIVDWLNFAGWMLSCFGFLSTQVSLDSNNALRISWGECSLKC